MCRDFRLEVRALGLPDTQHNSLCTHSLGLGGHCNGHGGGLGRVGDLGLWVSYPFFSRQEIGNGFT